VIKLDMDEKSIFADLLRARRFNRVLSQDDKWGFQNNTSTSYELSFEGLLKGKTIKDLVEERSMLNKQNIALDLMGFGDALSDLRLNCGLAVALSNEEKENKTIISNGMEIDLISGDIVSKITWNKVSEWLDRQHGAVDKNFSLVLCRPEGGMHTLLDDNDLFYFLLQQIWARLSYDSGVLFTQIPGTIGSPDGEPIIKKWIDLVNRHQGIHVEYQDQDSFKMAALKITKDTNAPVVFPKVF
jgi:hypothetical protein